MSHNLESVVESQRYLEALMNKIALGRLIDLSFQEAIDVCHWLNRRVRPIGKEWYLTASVKDGRYGLWMSSGAEYITTKEDLNSRWELA
ncbi:hypothetical protein KP1_244 [Klebsiella phage KP1]|uniref:Uncharacterized protein n=1 Tax=Klebsiella phage KP1 TaxID=2070202 RepID=A0A2K9V686_9CAUD|nr:hypothetical protein KP1_244 [Klebsiella phage KP1]